VPAEQSSSQFIVPELCNVPAISLVVLFGQLLVLVMLFGGGEISWVRFSLMSLYVQWVALTSAGLLCLSRGWLAKLEVVYGAIMAFGLVMLVTLSVALVADRFVYAGPFEEGIEWSAIGGQMLIAGIIAGLALRYFYVQQQLRAQEQLELKARLQALQSRIRPHFLFNSMNIIASLIATDPETAEAVVEDLSELFRASLNDAGNQVPIEDELDLCQRYVRIEALRLGNRMNMVWELDEPPGPVRIPLLTLQPLLENAIYHGIQPLPDGGTITLSLSYQEEEVLIRITNPVPPPQAHTNSRGNQMALNNIRSRLSVLYGNRASLQAQAEGDVYTTVLKFPMTEVA
jgi:two-component system sensor histidine kinase AlgZ